MNEVVAYEKNQLQMDAIVRAVAPRTLGIPYRELACTSDVVDRAKYRVNTDFAIGSAKAEEFGPPRGFYSSMSSSGDDELRVTRDNPERSRCEGALLPIYRAEDFLEDDEWLEGAEHAEQLRQAFLEWQEDGPPPDWSPRSLSRDRLFASCSTARDRLFLLGV